MAFSSEQKEILYYIELSAAVPSFLGTFFICVCYLFFKELRSFTFRLVVYLSLADMFTSLAFSIPHFVSDELCFVQSLLLNYSALTSLLWTMVIAYTLYKGVVLEEVELDRSEVNYIIFVCGVPIIAEFLPFTTESYGYAEGWCWIKIQNIQSDLDGSSTYNYGTFWRMATYYIPLWIVIVYNLWVYAKVIETVTETMDDVSSDNRTRHVILHRLRMYPFILVLCQTPATIHRIYAFFGQDETTTFILAIFASFFLLINGLLNAIVYGYTDSVKLSIRKRLFPQEFEVQTTNTFLGSVESQSNLFNNSPGVL